MRGNLLWLALPVLGLAMAAPAAMADDRDPAYAAARADGRIGEKVDGYLGVVGATSPAIAKMVDDLNIKRKAVYAQQAAAAHATVEEYAFTSGCHLIMRTVPGEKYQTPGGSWATRTAAAPERDSRCP